MKTQQLPVSTCSFHHYGFAQLVSFYRTDNVSVLLGITYHNEKQYCP